MLRSTIPVTAPTAPRYLHLTRLERLNAGLHHDSHPFLDRLSAESDDVSDAELAAAARPLDGRRLRDVRRRSRRSLERLKYSQEQLLRLFANVPAARVTGADILRYATLRLEQKAAPATVNRELAALRAAYRLGLDNDVIVAMPRIKLLPENNVRKGFADAKQVELVCRRLKDEVADGVRFAFQTMVGKYGR